MVVMMPRLEAEAVDEWATPAGMPSRTSAVKYLLKRGLETIRAEETGQLPVEEAAGCAWKTNPAAGLPLTHEREGRIIHA